MLFPPSRWCGMMHVLDFVARHSILYKRPWKLVRIIVISLPRNPHSLNTARYAVQISSGLVVSVQQAKSETRDQCSMLIVCADPESSQFSGNLRSNENIQRRCFPGSRRIVSINNIVWHGIAVDIPLEGEYVKMMCHARAGKHMVSVPCKWSKGGDT